MDKREGSSLVLPTLVSHGMILQRDEKLNIWGWERAGQKVTVQFREKEYSTMTDATGKWQVVLDEQTAGGPFEMVILASETITIEDILVGEVWLCSGQSNMELPINRVKDLFMEQLAHCENNEIRQFAVPQVYNFHGPLKAMEGGKWTSVTKESVYSFSATAYFFGKTLYEKYRVPIGLINASMGGTPVEAWMSEETLRIYHFDEALKELEIIKDDNYVKSVIADDQKRMNEWYGKLHNLDAGMREDEPWHEAIIPGYWDEMGLPTMNGVVWFKKEINVSKEMVGKQGRLLLGAIIDSDEVYINDVLVGTTGYCYPPRKYDVPDNILHEGKNTIVMKIVSCCGQAGFIKGKEYALQIGDQRIELAGSWAYQIGAIVEPLESQTFFQYKPTGLYNGMIAPMLEYRVKGVIWYQGESNTGQPEAYYNLFTAHIEAWRSAMKKPELPFLFVQLANFTEASVVPTDSNWATLRQMQCRTLTLPYTEMAVITDVGEWNDLHPLDKETVGKRLALGARRVAYGEEELISSGPIYRSMKVEGDRIMIDFYGVGKGLVTKNNAKLNHFAISEDGEHFEWANAEIVDDQVVVHLDGITAPRFVRYAWADNPEEANLYNRQGLPASCFSVGIDEVWKIVDKK